MARLIIVTVPELASGYRLAGATTLTASSPEEAERLVEQLVDEPDVALIGVHAPLWSGASPSLTARLSRRVLPVVIDIPTGEVSEVLERRARLAEMLRHAIGHRITFRKEHHP